MPKDLIMLIRLRDLRSLHVEGTDGASHKVIDLLVRRDAPDVTHVLTRLGRWLDRQGCAIRADAFGEPDLSRGVWTAAMGEDDVRETSGPVATVCGVNAAPDPADVAAADGTGPLARLSIIDETPVHGADGTVAGRVMDMVVDTEARRVALLIVHAGATGTEHQRVVPVEMFERVDWDAREVHLRCGADPVANAPDLHEVGDRIEGHWYNRVLAYYGVG
jgi:sporulation protein YlmC with PRC-barrel domain